MEHILFECSCPGQKEVWELAQKAWEKRPTEWIEPTFGIMMACGTTNFCDADGKALPVIVPPSSTLSAGQIKLTNPNAQNDFDVVFLFASITQVSSTPVPTDFSPHGTLAAQLAKVSLNDHSLQALYLKVVNISSPHECVSLGIGDCIVRGVHSLEREDYKLTGDVIHEVDDISAGKTELIHFEAMATFPSPDEYQFERMTSDVCHLFPLSPSLAVTYQKHQLQESQTLPSHCILAHPDFKSNNVIVSTSSDFEKLKVVGLLDPIILRDGTVPLPSRPLPGIYLTNSAMTRGGFHAFKTLQRRYGGLKGRCAMPSCVRTRGPTQDEGAERKAASNVRGFEACRGVIDIQTDTWVSNEIAMNPSSLLPFLHALLPRNASINFDFFVPVRHG
ncbi:hypothetical protein BDP27DRAFT_1416736 [Rhodocollybia butyracea]|uniref:Uncharacterized protein n=1 Tax=Rhodocollybia butyracea TaxID=206335 RepID=A0A9P5UCE9_9AGAR|nr:hypothetical protein BDP27DRAFT_1416736 [Rhodocollybia butyracea]